MKKGKYCHECGELVEMDERFCQNCGVELLQEEQENEVSEIGAGARANIMGGINKTKTTHNNVNTSNVDNSSTVNHNTTYVMNDKKKEFCEVCGNPLDEKHARCPKCGKEICLECKVKGKNRCLECEKKAINEYRVSFQQFLLTSNGNIGSVGRQMMNQKARDLDVEDAQSGVEKELQENYKPAVKAVQPEIVQTTAAAVGATMNLGTKNVGTPVYRKVENGANRNKSLWFFVILVLVAVIAVFVLLNLDTGSKDTYDKTDSMEQVQQKSVEQSATSTSEETKTEKTDKSVVQPASSYKNVISQPISEKKQDVNYEVGMKAYEAGKGLDAVNAFKKSGSAEAYYMLGLIYENGCGNIGKNAMMARKHFKKAAQMGNEDAKMKL